MTERDSVTTEEIIAYLRRGAVRLRRGLDRHDALNSEQYPDFHIGMAEGVDYTLDYLEGRAGQCEIDDCNMHPVDDFSEPVRGLSPEGAST